MRACAILLSIFLGTMARAADLTITANVTNKTATLSAQVSIGEILDVEITGIGASNPENLIMAVILLPSNLMAVASSFTNVSGDAEGQVSFHTEELWDYFENRKVGRAKHDFVLTVWDEGLDFLLVNTTMPILNNPYGTNVSGATSISNALTDADARYVLNTAFLPWKTETTNRLDDIEGQTNTWNGSLQTNGGTMGGPILMGGFKLKDVGTATLPNQATTLEQVMASNLVGEAYADAVTGALHVIVSAEIDSDVSAGASGMSNHVSAVASGISNLVSETASGISNHVSEVVSGSSNNVSSVASGLSNYVSLVASGSSNYVALATGTLDDVAFDGETDPVFLAHVAYLIAAAATQRWEEAYDWGDHAAVGYVATGYVDTATGTLHTIVTAEITAATGALQVVMCEQSFMDGASQTFSGGGYEIVTNFMANITDASYSRTHSNITVTPAGRYTVSLDLSFQNDGAGQFDCRLYTNNVEATDVGGNHIGWTRTVSAGSSDGVVSASKTIALAAGTVLDWRIDTAASEVATWDEGTWRVERK